MSYAAIIVGIGTIGYGAYSKARANKKTKDALAKRKSYQTPEEVYQILNALENRSQGDTQTRDYQTQQIDNGFAQSLDVAELLGADPNNLSAMFQQKMNGILQVGQQFHASNMEAFGKYLGGLDMVVQNKAAEFGSQQNIVKDQIQAAAAAGADANKTINSGLNLTMSGISSAASNKLYKNAIDNSTTSAVTGATAGVNGGFDNSVVTTAVPPISGAVAGAVATPQRTVGTDIQTIVQPAQPTNSPEYQQYLAWLQNPYFKK